MAPMQIRVEPMTLGPADAGRTLPAGIFRRAKGGETARGQRRKLTCDKASPARAVMLHLRACYVSKAAILTIPAPLVPVENRSPA
jgi:hypothetical protein